MIFFSQICFRFLSTLFKWEFIYKPKAKDAFVDNFQKTFELMVEREILVYNKEMDLISLHPKGMLKSHPPTCGTRGAVLHDPPVPPCCAPNML